MQLPSISVVTPSLNSAQFLEDAILGVALQQGVTTEHIVVDALSTDATPEVLRRHPQVQWTSEPDQGQSDAINKGFLRAKGDLVGWLNADDYYLPGSLEAVARTAHDHPEADVIFGDCVFVDSGGRIARSKVEHRFDFKLLLYFGCHIPSTSTFFRRRVIEQGLLLSCDYSVNMDFEYFIRLAHSGYSFHYLPRFLAAFRWHNNNVSLRLVERRIQERRRVQHHYGARAYSVRQLALLRQWSRVKRLGRKLLTGNLKREIQIRMRAGDRTLWMRHPEDLALCERVVRI